MILHDTTERLRRISDPLLAHRVGDNIVYDFTDKSKYLVITHQTPITSRDIMDLTILASGLQLSRGLKKSGADLEITRVSDVQTVIKCNRDGIEALVIKKEPIVYPEPYPNGDFVLKWTFLEPDEDETYVIMFTPTDTGIPVVVDTITKTNLGSWGTYVEGPEGPMSGYYTYTIPGGVINAAGGTYTIQVTNSHGTYVINNGGGGYSFGGSGGYQDSSPISGGGTINISGGTSVNIGYYGGIVQQTTSYEGGGAPAAFEGPQVVLSTGNLPRYSTYKLRKPYVIKGYSVDSRLHQALAAKSWNFQASNDGVNFDTLDSQTGITDWTAVRFRALNHNTAYMWYRFMLTDTVSPGPEHECIIDEIILYGNLMLSDDTDPPVTTATVTFNEVPVTEMNPPVTTATVTQAIVDRTAPVTSYQIV